MAFATSCKQALRLGSAGEGSRYGATDILIGILPALPKGEAGCRLLRVR